MQTKGKSSGRCCLEAITHRSLHNGCSSCGYSFQLWLHSCNKEKSKTCTDLHVSSVEGWPEVAFQAVGALEDRLAMKEWRGNA